MTLHIALTAEILATISCLYCIYGKKVTWDVKTTVAVLGSLVILEIINTYQMGGGFSFLVYVLLFIFCKSEFHYSVADTILSLLLYIIILSPIQFLCVSMINIVISEKQLVRNAIGNVLVLIICMSVLPRCGLHRLQKSILKKSKEVLLLLGFVCFIIMILLLQEKIYYAIQMQYFIFAVPAILILLYLILKWHTAQAEAEKMKEEIYKIEENAKEYESLLTKVRLRQHELKNHMAAIFSAHYTYKTYEKLVQAQEEYCNKLLCENKYNNLLLLEDKVLAGYLYRKFQEAEADGIEIKYKIAVKADKIQVPVYYIIEMLGILFDNAVESLKISEKKIISFEVCETKDGYAFHIKNPFPYVPYDEISEWFKLGKSGKGSERGLGLYHLKCLCREWNCDIGCRNIEMEQHNWIVFTLKTGKVES